MVHLLGVYYALLGRLTKHKASMDYKQEILLQYAAAEKPYDVCIHTTMGSYMEFCNVERGIMFEDTARMVCDRYAAVLRKGTHPNFKGVCVRKGCTIIYEVGIN